MKKRIFAMLVLSLGLSNLQTSVFAAQSSASQSAAVGINLAGANQFLVDLNAEILAKNSQMGALTRQAKTASTEPGRRLKRFAGLRRDYSAKQKIECKIAQIAHEISILETCKQTAGKNPGFLKKSWVRISKIIRTHKTKSLLTAAVIVTSVYSLITYGDMTIWHNFASSVGDYMPDFTGLASYMPDFTGLGDYMPDFTGLWGNATSVIDQEAATAAEAAAAAAAKAAAEATKDNCYSWWNPAGKAGDLLTGRNCA